MHMCTPPNNTAVFQQHPLGLGDRRAHTATHTLSGGWSQDRGPCRSQHFCGVGDLRAGNSRVLDLCGVAQASEHAPLVLQTPHFREEAKGRHTLQPRVGAPLTGPKGGCRATDTDAVIYPSGHCQHRDKRQVDSLPISSKDAKRQKDRNQKF